MIWTMVLVPTIVQLSRGWVATGDDAVIAIRTDQVFSTHSPLVGIYSSASTIGTHTLFDLGPLVFWTLAVPVRVDPAHGALWGAALACGTALSLAVEALWRSDCWPGCLLVAAAVADLAWHAPDVFGNPIWNPYFGLLVLTASVALAWVVATGHLGWWPVLVVVASMAAQSHLAYVIPSLALALAAPIVGVAMRGSKGRLRWAVAGVAVGIVVWVVPVAQELFGRPGNMTVLLQANNGRPRAGVPFGLQAIAVAGSPVPIWLRPFPKVFPPGHSMASLVRAHSPLAGATILVLTALLALVGWRRKNPGLVALSIVSLALGCGVAATFASFPHKDSQLASLYYISWMCLVYGIVLWITAAWAAVEAVQAAVRLRRRDEAPLDPPLGRGSRPSVAAWDRTGEGNGQRQHFPRQAEHLPDGGRRSTVQSGLLAIGLVALVTFCILGAASVASPSRVDRFAASQDSLGRTIIERMVPRGPVVVQAPFQLGVDNAGIAWNLMVDGWQPRLSNRLAAEETGLTLPSGTRWPTVVVTPTGDPIFSCLTNDRVCRPQLSIVRIR